MLKPATNELVEGLAYALETLAFVCLAPAEMPELPQQPVRCTMVCKGSLAMRLNMIAPLSLGHVIAANMLGTDPGDPEAVNRAFDSLREVMNVTCGALCAKVGEAELISVELELPDATAIEGDAAKAAWDAALAGGAMALDADGNTIAVWLEVLE